MSNEQLQQDEVEALAAIYGSEWVVEDYDKRTFSIEIKSDVANETNHEGNSITMQIQFPSDYPLSAPPLYTLSAPWMSRREKVRLMNDLEDLYAQNVGESIVYLWIEKLREYLVASDQSDGSKESDDVSPSDELIDYGELVHSKLKRLTTEELQEIVLHGEPVIDRRSVFQAHAAAVACVEHAKDVIEYLKSDKKISGATHNITAYRLTGGPHNTCLQDCDDDGEAHAGGRLLHLMQILDVRNVVVMVSRWFGGIQLGPDRFKHINNVARDLLEKGGFLEANNSEPTVGQKKKKK